MERAGGVGDWLRAFDLCEKNDVLSFATRGRTWLCREGGARQTERVLKKADRDKQTDRPADLRVPGANEPE